MVRKKCDWYPGSMHHITTRYIHLNPVRANMVKKPEEHEYSSYRMYIGNEKEKIISTGRLLSCFKEENKRELYKAFVEGGINLKRVAFLLKFFQVKIRKQNRKVKWCWIPLHEVAW